MALQRAIRHGHEGVVERVLFHHRFPVLDGSLLLDAVQRKQWHAAQCLLPLSETTNIHKQALSFSLLGGNDELALLIFQRCSREQQASFLAMLESDSPIFSMSSLLKAWFEQQELTHKINLDLDVRHEVDKCRL